MRKLTKPGKNLCSIFSIACHIAMNYNNLMSEAIAFDTHRFVKNLTQNGFTEKQAEALANEQVQLLNSNLATKTDILTIQASIETIHARIETIHARIETVQAELQARIETVQAELQARIETTKADLLKWILMAIIAQGGLVVALIKLL